ncbi:MAG: hypothetical protein WBG32_07960 [Nodosilinea sp.]
MRGQATAIRDRGGSHPYSSEIEVSALQGDLSDLRVTLNAIDHTWPLRCRSLCI